MPERHADFDIGHPAPARDEVSMWLVWIGILAAPVAWSLQLGANSAIAGLACLDERGAALGLASEATATIVVVINLAAVAVAALALAISYRNLRRSHEEELRRSGGVMEAGEGRTRFLSVWGVWISILFLIASVASTISVKWSGMCPS